ncbi:MAG: GNAT family N-acetyltransferase [Candidatus Wukongarchaeota archaeon]|nr:GNAT family N-acetyltransferase [Candidatus Wukongarchaeota archaeon]
MFIEIKICEPQTKQEFKKYYELRWKILRKPWKQPKGSEKDEREKEATHIMACIDSKIVGVGRLHFNTEKEAQIRYMAIEEEYRRKGVGSLILKELEKRAKEKGAEHIVLNAREKAVKFYKKHDYKTVKRTYTLFESINHWKMQKRL